MPRKAKTHPRTKFAEFLRKARGEFTQGEFQEKYLDCGPAKNQYLSKVETGIIRQPNDGFLQAVSDYTKTPLSELRQMCEESAESAERGENQFRLLFGHCIWAAPLVLVAREGKLPMFKFASFGRKEDDTWNFGNTWIKGDSMGDIPGRGANLPTMSGHDVRILLEKGQADVAALPWEVIERNDLEFERVASIVDTWTGCTFVTTKENLAATQGSLPNDPSTEDLGNYLVKLADARGKTRLRVVAERGTAAEKYLRDAEHWITKHHPGHSILHGDDVLSNQPNRNLADSDYGAIQNACGGVLAGVITWEPHATWLKQRDKHADSSLQSFRLHFKGSDQPRRLTFDLVTYIGRQTRSEGFYSSLLDLVYRLHLWAERLTSVSIEGKPEVWDHEMLLNLGRYFNLTGDRNVIGPVSDALKGIRYRVIWDPAFVKLHLAARRLE